LDQRGSIDLKTGKIGNPADETTDAILRGRPARVSFASPIMMRSVVPPDES